MFLIWAIPLAIVLLLLVLWFLGGLRNRVRTAHREQGKVLYDE